MGNKVTKEENDSKLRDTQAVNFGMEQRQSL